MDKQQWNERYLGRHNLFLPEEFLVQRKGLLSLRTVLDVACGDGRHSLFLARRGFDVTGVDFSEEGLNRLNSIAGSEGLRVETHCRDLSVNGSLSDLGLFDNVIVVHFKPLQQTFNEIVSALRTGGTLLMTSFNARQHEEKGFAKAFCYNQGEYLGLDKSLQLTEYCSYKDNRGYFDGYVFQKT